MKLAACIVETRNIPDLENTIQRHMKFLPEDTDLHLWVGSETEYLAEKFPNATVRMIVDMSIQKYNQLLTSINFWNLYLDYDRVLIFQSDSTILRRGIEDFFQCDFVGAPWVWQWWGFNGGFSLRNPRVMKEISEKYPFNVTLGNEDVYYCNIMYQKKIGKLASRELGFKFAAEGIFKLGSFGSHATGVWLSKDECNKIKTQYDEK